MVLHQMHGIHEISLVALSFIIAFMVALAALDSARRVNFSKGWKRKLWLFSGSVAMGIGVWSIHFIGMTAFQLSVPITTMYFLSPFQSLLPLALP